MEKDQQDILDNTMAAHANRLLRGIAKGAVAHPAATDSKDHPVPTDRGDGAILPHERQEPVMKKRWLALFGDRIVEPRLDLIEFEIPEEWADSIRDCIRYLSVCQRMDTLEEQVTEEAEAMNAEPPTRLAVNVIESLLEVRKSWHDCGDAKCKTCAERARVETQARAALVRIRAAAKGSAGRVT